MTKIWCLVVHIWVFLFGLPQNGFGFPASAFPFTTKKGGTGKENNTKQKANPKNQEKRKDQTNTKKHKNKHQTAKKRERHTTTTKKTKQTKRGRTKNRRPRFLRPGALLAQDVSTFWGSLGPGERRQRLREKNVPERSMGAAFLVGLKGTPFLFWSWYRLFGTGFEGYPLLLWSWHPLFGGFCWYHSCFGVGTPFWVVLKGTLLGTLFLMVLKGTPLLSWSWYPPFLVVLKGTLLLWSWYPLFGGFEGHASRFGVRSCLHLP